jgi:arsenite-transporting ATPase
MLAMPETLLGLARLFDRLQAKHRVMVEALRGRWTPEEDDRVIDGMAEEASALAALLRDEARTSMSWVTLPEPMAVEETLDAAAAMSAQGIRIREVVFNRVTAAPPGPCRWCGARQRFERDAIAALRRRLGRGSAAPVLRTVAAREAEPTGLRSLLAVGREALRAASFPGRVPAPGGGRRRVAGRTDVGTAGPVSRVADTANLVMFGGKGGAGKTTCAAAEAVAMAAADSGRRVLLLSTDPAHSLADALGVPLADTPRRLPGAPRNLLARELDAGAQFARVRERYSAAIDALFERLARGSAVDVAQDRRVMQDLIELAPPGVDELAAVIDVVDALEAGAGDLIVLDTAPSGHALRLLEMPAIVQEWTRALMAILLKYQPVVGIGELGSLLLKLSQGIGRLRAQLADADRTRFIVVTRAAAVVRAESVRLAARLAALHVAVPVVVVNALGAGDCARCRRQRAAERREVARLRRALPGGRARAQLAAAPAWMPPPHGRAALAEWRRAWRTLP